MEFLVAMVQTYSRFWDIRMPNVTKLEFLKNIFHEQGSKTRWLFCDHGLGQNIT